MVRFHFLTGDINWLKYGGKWISNRQNNGDFDYWLVLELSNLEEEVREKDKDNKYAVSLAAVSPEQAGEKEIDSAIGCCGGDRDIAEYSPNDVVDFLHSSGVCVPLWYDHGPNARKLLEEGRKQANISASLFGFYMDRQVNQIGATGWDAIKGNFIPEEALGE